MEDIRNQRPFGTTWIFRHKQGISKVGARNLSAVQNAERVSASEDFLDLCGEEPEYP